MRMTVSHKTVLDLEISISGINMMDMFRHIRCKVVIRAQRSVAIIEILIVTRCS